MKRRTVVLFVLLLVFLTGCITSKTPVAPPDTPDDNEPEVLQPEEFSATGIYQGQIDSNSVELAVKDDAGAEIIQAFRLGVELKESLPEMNLKMGQQIEFVYFMNEYDQPVLITVNAQ